MNCFFYTLYDRFKQTRLASVLFYHGKRYEHFDEITITGIAKDCEHVQGGDGDRCFDVVQPQLGTNAPATVWHCEATPCSPALARRKAQQVREGEKVQVSGTRTFDPPHDALGIHLGGGLNEVHPVKAITFLLALLMLAAPSLRAQTDTAYAYKANPTSAVQYVAQYCGQRILSTGGVENVACLDSNDGLSWGEAKATVAAAYSAIVAAGASGGIIHVAAGNYSYSSGLTFGTLGVAVKVECAPGDATTITYTGTSGIFLTFDWGTVSGSYPQTGWAGGIEGCTLVNSQTSGTTAIYDGGANNGAMGLSIQNNRIFGFGTPIVIEPVNSGFIARIDHNVLEGRGTITAGSAGVTVGNGGSVPVENTALDNNLIAGYNDCLIVNGGDVTAIANSFDDCETAWVNVETGSSILTLLGTHWENASDRTPNYLVQSAGSVSIFGGEAIDDIASGTVAQEFTSTGGDLVVSGLYANSAGQTVTDLFNLTGVNAQFGHVTTVTGISNVFVESGSDISDISYPTWELKGFGGGGVNFSLTGLTALRTLTFPDQSGTLGLIISATTTSLTWSALSANSCANQTVTVTGATTSMLAEADPSAQLSTSGNLDWSSRISAANTIEIKVCNVSTGSITPNTVTWNVRVIQ